ncbi:Protein of centriole 5 [Caenorhabditis elegans]|uniref:Protein of centriole 5 n=1 Tax=Caenorhabditis elegans TaxID=6239 RepID=A0A3B1E4U6_CAEEL|nr:Protein of centriole 5 [Caenorhabditis elegans]VAY52146.1 Protein of centriole 5 [Caenorhabditis elegans]|eukprot:NP_001355422.1 Uncharacterized protein CELE_Y49F6A.11 [Caenorhabditis elegans]
MTHSIADFPNQYLEQPPAEPTDEDNPAPWLKMVGQEKASSEAVTEEEVIFANKCDCSIPENMKLEHLSKQIAIWKRLEKFARENHRFLTLSLYREKQAQRRSPFVGLIGLMEKQAKEAEEMHEMVHRKLMIRMEHKEYIRKKLELGAENEKEPVSHGPT